MGRGGNVVKIVLNTPLRNPMDIQWIKSVHDIADLGGSKAPNSHRDSSDKFLKFQTSISNSYQIQI